MRPGLPARGGSRTNTIRELPVLLWAGELPGRAVFAAQPYPGLNDSRFGSSLQANGKVCPEQATHHPGTSSLGPNLHALCPFRALGRTSQICEALLAWMLLSPGTACSLAVQPPQPVHSWGEGKRQPTAASGNE